MNDEQFAKLLAALESNTRAVSDLAASVNDLLVVIESGIEAEDEGDALFQQRLFN